MMKNLPDTVHAFDQVAVDEQLALASDVYDSRFLGLRGSGNRDKQNQHGQDRYITLKHDETFLLIIDG